MIRRQEMCGQMRHTILADRRLIGHPSGGFSLKSAAGGPDQRCFPPSVSPLWNPPFLIPPSNSNTPKGENRRGQQRGVSTGAAEETAGPLSPRGAARLSGGPPTIDGLPVDEFIARNADPIWLFQNGMYSQSMNLYWSSFPCAVLGQGR
jgi:hypothetical protein